MIKGNRDAFLLDCSVKLVELPPLTYWQLEKIMSVASGVRYRSAAVCFRLRNEIAANAIG